jgi:hypothetical protein
MESAIGAEVTVVERYADWRREAYRSRRGPELWWPLLLAALLLLIAESFVASSGRASGSTGQTRTTVAAEA